MMRTISRIPGRPRHVVGSRHHLAKLAEGDIPVIRQLHREGVSTRAIARKYEVSQRAIYQVVAHISWRHVL
jgi:DNA invertase Pin-like site-specific DNA recombinase